MLRNDIDHCLWFQEKRFELAISMRLVNQRSPDVGRVDDTKQ